ncbi:MULTISPECIES: hypothetical protein [unclassified Thioalkalivibrio]|uniref:hypothetical protein n=1 Tax=unclassified Thioalkalivibrio TaxID=2621013 RepID=UPI00037C0CBA|nr:MULTISPECIES: hypothetical protein [unclassified Thioalkalivibrio]
MRDYTIEKSPWGNYGFVVRRSVDNQIFHRTFSAKVGRDTPEEIEEARQAAEAYDRELIEAQQEARERKRRERKSNGLSPVEGIIITFNDRSWGRDIHYRFYTVRLMRKGRLYTKRFAVNDYGDRGAWISACKHLAAIEGIDPDPLIRRYPGEEVWDRADALRRHNRGETVPKEDLEGTPYG